jgi:oligopeptide transport system permease protein
MSEQLRVNPAAVDIKKFAADIDFNAYQLQRAKRDESQLNKVVRPSLTYWQDAWYKLRHNPVATVGLCLLIIYVFLAIFAPILSQYDFGQQNAAAKNMKPCAEHIFGTDAAGRDLWVRNWMGARVSLTIGLVVVLINTASGILVGGVSGYFGGKVDMVMMRIVDIIYSLPDVLIVILLSVAIKDWVSTSKNDLIARLGAGMVSIFIVFGLLYWGSMARQVRGQILSIKEQEYVLASKAIGASPARIIRKHMIPNCVSVIIIIAAMQIPSAIFTESFLSFLGLGVSVPMPSLGSLASDARTALRSYPYQLIFPAISIFLIVLSFNLLGNGLRDAFDPKLRN